MADYYDLLETSPINIKSIDFIDEDIRTWRIKFRGPKESFYKGGMLSLLVYFPNDYPYTSPVVRFETPIFHPKVHEIGTVCLEILNTFEWSPAYSVTTILSVICFMLCSPEPDWVNDDWYNNYAAELCKFDPKCFADLAKTFTTAYYNDD